MSMLPGVAALLLQRGCPEDRLDEVVQTMINWPMPTTLSEAVEHADNAIRAAGIERA